MRVLDISESQQSIVTARQAGGEALTRAYAESTNFAAIEDESALPVLIAARNEEDDLPAALLSLSLSHTPVTPIVIDNGSSDRTASFAEAFGVQVLSEPQPGKQRALSSGLDWLFKKRGIGETILLTDADVIAPMTWAASLAIAIEQMDPDLPRVAAGTVRYYEDGQQIAKNALLTIMSLVRDVRARNRGVMRAKGNNMAIHPAGNTKVASGLIELATTHGNWQPLEDRAVVDVILQQGGQAQQVFDQEARMLARGDRYPSIAVAARVLLLDRSNKYRNNKLYASWHPEEASDLTLVQKNATPH